jgi:AcrR family transcriptional regulator
MPQVIDAADRTDDIIRGICRLIVTEGLDALTMRNIAREVGRSTGSLHHHYESRGRLLRVAVHWFAKDLVGEHAMRRRDEGPCGFLPGDLDALSRTRAWLAFAELGRSATDIGAVVAEARAHERWLLATSVNPEHDPGAALEAYALLDGVRGALCSAPDAMPLDTAREILAGAVNRSRPAA